MQNVDEQIDVEQEALEEWLKVLARLWTFFGKPLEPDRFEQYRRSLFIVPLGLLEKAIDRVVREHVYNSVPTPAQVWGAVRKELGNPYDIDQAIEQWGEASWRRCFVSFEKVPAELAI